MISFMNDAQAAVEELRMFLEVDSLDEMKKKPTNSPVVQEHGESPTSDSSPSSLAPTTPSEGDSGWPIALRKGTRSSRNPHPIYNFLSYNRLSPSYYSLLSSVSSVVSEN